MSNNCHGVPASFNAGDTVSFTLTYTQYPASAWALTFYLYRNDIAGGLPTSQAATVDGTSFIVTLSAAATGALQSGLFEWAAQVTNSGTVKTAEQGTTIVLPNYMVAQAPTTAQQMLAGINAAINRLLAAGEFASTNFNGQSYSFADIDKLRNWRVQLQAEVIREIERINRARGGPDPGRIQTQFAPQGWCGPFPFTNPFGYFDR